MLFSEEGDEETDGAALNLIVSIVEKVRRQLEKETFGKNLKNFLITLTKIFTLLLNIKVDTADKIIKIIQLLNSAIAKKWLEQKWLRDADRLEDGLLEKHIRNLK